MDKYKEFQGTDFDDCIAQAIKWFDAPRESLEIEILQDAKSGIFGIVGARKAKIRARRACIAEKVRTLLDTAIPSQDQAERAVQPEKKRGSVMPATTPERPKKAEAHADAGQSIPTDARKARAVESIALEESKDFEEELLEDAARGPKELDADAVAELSLSIVKRVLEPITGREISAQVSMESGKPRVRVEWEGDAGMLIGREGQTLAAIQYLASRILSRAIGAPLNLQLDVGDYRSRQDEKLRGLALSLAEKVRRTGRPLSTRPLSSYHRRVVHLCLQSAEDLQTRSAGEGPLKRVLISPRRS